MDDARCLGRIVHGEHGVIIAAVGFSEMAGGLVGGKGPDVPRADAEDVLHGWTIHPPRGTCLAIQC